MSFGKGAAADPREAAVAARAREACGQKKIASLVKRAAKTSKSDKLVTLDDFDPDCASAPPINSPRSIEACLRQGVLPEELAFKPESHYHREGQPDRINRLRFERAEERRLFRLQSCKEERARIAEADEKELLATKGLPGAGPSEKDALDPSVLDSMSGDVVNGESHLENVKKQQRREVERMLEQELLLAEQRKKIQEQNERAAERMQQQQAENERRRQAVIAKRRAVEDRRRRWKEEEVRSANRREKELKEQMRQEAKEALAQERAKQEEQRQQHRQREEAAERARRETKALLDRQAKEMEERVLAAEEEDRRREERRREQQEAEFREREERRRQANERIAQARRAYEQKVYEKELAQLEKEEQREELRRQFEARRAAELEEMQRQAAERAARIRRAQEQLQSDRLAWKRRVDEEFQQRTRQARERRQEAMGETVQAAQDHAAKVGLVRDEFSKSMKRLRSAKSQQLKELKDKEVAARRRRQQQLAKIEERRAIKAIREEERREGLERQARIRQYEQMKKLRKLEVLEAKQRALQGHRRKLEEERQKTLKRTRTEKDFLSEQFIVVRQNASPERLGKIARNMGVDADKVAKQVAERKDNGRPPPQPRRRVRTAQGGRRGARLLPSPLAQHHSMAGRQSPVRRPRSRSRLQRVESSPGMRPGRSLRPGAALPAIPSPRYKHGEGQQAREPVRRPEPKQPGKPGGNELDSLRRRQNDQLLQVLSEVQAEETARNDRLESATRRAEGLERRAQMGPPDGRSEAAEAARKAKEEVARLHRRAGEERELASQRVSRLTKEHEAALAAHEKRAAAGPAQHPPVSPMKAPSPQDIDDLVDGVLMDDGSATISGAED